MEDLVKKLSERQLTTSEILSISNASVPKTSKKIATLAWVDVAKCLLKRVVEKDNVKLAHNVRIFIEISVKAEVKFCMNASAKLNRKQCPYISSLLTFINCMADTVTQPTQSISELDVGDLKALLFAAVIDLQVTGVRINNEKKLAAELYTKLTAIFEQSSEKFCDCLLLCHCLIYKNHRKPKVLIPLIRQVLCSEISHSSLRYVSGKHYIKLLLLSKIWLLMVDTDEVSAVHSLVAGVLKVPKFFREWLDQNDIPWLRQTNKNLTVKNILKCMTVTEVLETLYGANKVTCKISSNIKQVTKIDVPQVKEEEMEIKVVTKTKKKNKIQTLDPSQTKGKDRVHMTPMQPRGRNKIRGRRIFTSESSNWSTPTDKQREIKLSGSMSEIQKERKSALSKEDIFSNRKRVRQDSLTFTITELTEEEITLLKVKKKRIVLPEKDFSVEKVSVGIQTDLSLLNEIECDAKFMKPKTEPSIKLVSEINTSLRALQILLDSPASYQFSSQLGSLSISGNNSSEEQSSEIRTVVQTDVTLNQNEIDKSQEVLKPSHSSNHKVPDSNIEVMEEVQDVKSSSKTPKEVECILSDELDIDDTSGNKGNLVSCNDRLKMFTNEENHIYHKKLKKKEQKRNEVDMEQGDTSTAEAETNNETVESIGNYSEVQIFDGKPVHNKNELKLETQSSNNESVANICQFKENMLKNETRSFSEFNSKTSDLIMDTNQDLKPKTNDETKKCEIIAIKDIEKEVNIYIPEAKEELTKLKLNIDNVCTTQEEAKAWLPDQDEVYEASSDASEEQPRAPTHTIRKKMSERKCSAALANVQIASDSDMSPVRTTQRRMRSADKSKNHKNDNIQSSYVINFGHLEESMASVSLLHNINDSSFESNFSSTSIISTDMLTDGLCGTVMPAPTTTIITNGSDLVKDSKQDGNSDTLESRKDSFMVSKNLCENLKTALDGDKSVVTKTMASDATEDVLEETTNKDDVEPPRNDAAKMPDIFDSVTNSKIIENGQELEENKDIAKILLKQDEPSRGYAVDAQTTAESVLLTKGRVDNEKDEELKVFSIAGVDYDDGEEHVPTRPCLTQSENTLSGSSHTVSPHCSTSVFHQSTIRCQQSSQSQGNIVGDTEYKPGNPALAPQSQRLATQVLHKELLISPSVSCKLNNQSEIKADVTAHSSTTEDSHKQNLAKNYSKENNPDKTHNKSEMNDPLQNKMSKADKKNEKLKVGENYDRINYLVQASQKVFKNDKAVSSQLGSLAISFGRRLPQVRLDPLLKREMCKGCGVYLEYGVNAKVRHRSKRQKHLVVTCLTCHTIKRFVTNPNHKLWSEQPESQV